MRHASDDNAAAAALVAAVAAPPPPHHEVASAALVAADDRHNRYFRREIETEHPYPVAVRRQWDAVFPGDVQVRARGPSRVEPGGRAPRTPLLPPLVSLQWLLITFDPRCGTGQPEDRVTLYADAGCARKLGASYFGSPLSAPIPVPAPGAPKQPPISRRWPTGPFIVGGNALTVVFESASDYLKQARAVTLLVC